MDRFSKIFAIMDRFLKILPKMERIPGFYGVPQTGKVHVVLGSDKHTPTARLAKDGFFGFGFFNFEKPSHLWVFHRLTLTDMWVGI
jgi:hypothetical protein